MSDTVREWMNAKPVIDALEARVKSLERDLTLQGTIERRHQTIADLRAALLLITAAIKGLPDGDPLRNHVNEIARKALDGR